MELYTRAMKKVNKQVSFFENMFTQVNVINKYILLNSKWSTRRTRRIKVRSNSL